MILSILQHIIPMGVIIALGWLCAKLKLFNQTFAQGLTVFILYLALPSLVFMHLATENIAHSTVKINFIIGFLFIILTCFFISRGLGKKLFKTNRTTNTLRALCTTHTNLGVFGFPILTTVMGHGVVLPLIMANALLDTVELPLAIWLLEASKHKKDSGNFLYMALGSALRAFSKPLVIAAILGVTWSYTQLPINTELSNSLNILANSSSACSLFLIGLIIYFQPCKINREVMFTTGCKLILQPALALIAIYLFHIHGTLAYMLILFSCIPTGVTSIVLSEKYNNYQSHASATVVLSTILALPAIGIIIAHIKH